LARATRPISSSRNLTLRLRSRSFVPTAPAIRVIFFHGADQRPNPISQQGAVGRMVNVGFHHSRIYAHPSPWRDLHHPLVNLLEYLWTKRLPPNGPSSGDWTASLAMSRIQDNIARVDAAPGCEPGRVSELEHAAPIGPWRSCLSVLSGSAVAPSRPS